MVSGSRMQRRVLHTADLHLESLDDKACHSLDAIVDLAIKSMVDLVIVAGDLFDHNRVGDNLVSFVVEQLQRLPVYVAILPGNHDCLAPNSVYHRAGLWRGITNVRVFKAPRGETLTLPSLGVSLWGRPMDSYESDVRPLAGIPQPQGNGQWHIALAHGYYSSAEAHSYRSFPISREEIVTSGWDYIALGHWPDFSCICDEPVKACYCGAPHISGTVAIVDLTEETGVQVTRYSLSNKQYNIST